MKLSAVRVFVDRLDEAHHFYATTLRLPLKAGGSALGFCVFDVGGEVDLVVEAVPPDAPHEERCLVGRFTGVSFRVDDIAEQFSALAARGVVFTGAPERQYWGGQLATFCDPSGNELQLVQPPGG